jgi:hypothetical protein
LDRRREEEDRGVPEFALISPSSVCGALACLAFMPTSNHS